MKARGEATDWREIDRHDGGVGWLAHPEELMQRASHALAVDGEVWLVDPIDVPGLDDLLAEFGEVAGVVLLLDRHKRDCATLANRHDVSVWIPDFMEGVATEVGAPVERFDDELADTGFILHKLFDTRFWQEGVLFNRNSGVLVVPEAVGTTDYFVTTNERLGVHPMLRLMPPTDLSDIEAKRLLVGHGTGIHEDAQYALKSAVCGSRVHAPGLFVKNTLTMLSPFR